MTEYKTLGEVQQYFKQGGFRLDHEITVHGLEYIYRDSIMYPIVEMVEKDYKAFVIYTMKQTAKNSELWQMAANLPEEKRPLNEWIVLIWAITPQLIIAPAHVASTTIHRAKADLETATRSLAPKPLPEGTNSRIIPDIVNIKFPRFTREVQGKVDSGANMSSIHAENWKVIPGTKRVEFISPILSNNRVMMDLDDQVLVATSEGQEVRPVVSFEVGVNGHILKNAKFNLNNRSQMKYPVLIGQNILEEGNFLIDPNKIKDKIPTESQDISIDWEILQELFKDIKVDSEINIHENKNSREIEEAYETLLRSNVSLQDIMRHLKTKVYNTLEETIDY